MTEDARQGQGVGAIFPLSMLGIADLDYVAARSLMMSAIFPAGQAKAAEAVEKLLKLSAMCIYAMHHGRMPTPRELRAQKHGIVDLFQQLIERFRVENADASGLLRREEDRWVWSFVSHLQEAYKHRYPDSWAPSMTYTSLDLDKLDTLYVWLRNQIVPLLPSEAVEKGRTFGTSFSPAYTAEVLTILRDRGLPNPFELLQLHNEKFSELEIDRKQLPGWEPEPNPDQSGGDLRTP